MGLHHRGISGYIVSILAAGAVLAVATKPLAYDSPSKPKDPCEALKDTGEGLSCATAIAFADLGTELYDECNPVVVDNKFVGTEKDKRLEAWRRIEILRRIKVQEDALPTLRTALTEKFEAIKELVAAENTSTKLIVEAEITSIKIEIEKLRGKIGQNMVETEALWGLLKGDKVEIDAKLDPKVVAQKAVLETEIKGIVDQRATALYGKAGNMSTGVCHDYCDTTQNATMKVDVCDFRERRMAAAAVIADETKVREVIVEIEKALALQGGGKSEKMTRTAPSDRGGGGLELALGGAGPAIDIAGTTARAADIAMAALAKVIVDRAKREGVGFFLAKLHENVCEANKPKGVFPEKPTGPSPTKPQKLPDDATPDKKNEYAAALKIYDDWQVKTKRYDVEAPKWNQWRAIQELRTHWLPTTCKLAGGGKAQIAMTQYGGGAELVRSLQGAITADVKAWPGVAAGLGMASLFWQDTHPRPNDKKSMFACYDDSPPEKELCFAMEQLRTATAKMTTDVMLGVNALESLHSFGTSINALNTYGTPKTFYSKTFQLAACSVSLPYMFQSQTRLVGALVPGQLQQSQALLSGAVVGAPACAAITIARSSRTYPSLDAVALWGNATNDAAYAVVGEWNGVQSAWKSYASAVGAFNQAEPMPTITLPSLQIGEKSDKQTIQDAFLAAENFAKNTAHNLQESKHVKLLQSASALTHASVDLGVAFTNAGLTLTDRKLFPGICKDEGKCKELPEKLQAGHEVLVGLSKKLDIVDNALNQDWAQVVPRVIAAINADLEEACKDDPQCTKVSASLARYAGFFTAVATDPDPEHVAQALDAAAAPIGGWRAKNIPGATNITISAFPGFISGLELRWGQYGVNYEHGTEPHLISPALALPVGVDVSCHQYVKVFFSVLDPAAYLQYDAEKDGRLPGAQLLTALAPGAAVRFALGDSPFSANIFGTFRPAFRAWESGVSTRGANVFQLGLSLSVDVTLFDIYSSQPDIKVDP